MIKQYAITDKLVLFDTEIEVPIRTRVITMDISGNLDAWLCSQHELDIYPKIGIWCSATSDPITIGIITSPELIDWTKPVWKEEQ